MEMKTVNNSVMTLGNNVGYEDIGCEGNTLTK